MNELNKKIQISGSVFLLLFLCASERLCAQRSPNAHRLSRANESTLNHPEQLSVNRIRINFMNLGGLDPRANPISKWEGWGSNDWAFDMVYDQGLWISGKRNGSVGCLPHLWSSSYSPGPIINGQPALKVRPQDSERYRVYGLTRGDTPDLNPDLAAWPADLGAPVDASGKPLVHGDQMAWMIYNGADTTVVPLNARSFYQKVPRRTVLPVEVHHSAFEHFGEVGDTSVWANAVFLEWAIYNRGPDPLDSVFLSLWSDIDFYDAQRTIPAVDTLAQTGYCWYGSDSTFGSVGYTLLFGPVVPSPGSTATFFGKTLTGYRNLPLSSFWGIIDDSVPDSFYVGPPYSLGTGWNAVRGLTPRGTPIIDSSTHRATKFPFSGDPITATGSLFPKRLMGGGAGFMITTGPCSIAPGDSQWVMIALIPSVKLNGVDAINRMRASAAYLHSLPYDSLVSKKDRRSVPINPLPVFDIPTSFELKQNYPNPFNGGTVIPFDLPEKGNVRIEVFDMLGRSIAVLADQPFERGHRSVSWVPSQSSGVYLVKLNARSLESASSWTGITKVVFVK
jgi:hypothetical protein